MARHLVTLGRCGNRGEGMWLQAHICECDVAAFTHEVFEILPRARPGEPGDLHPELRAAGDATSIPSAVTPTLSAAPGTTFRKLDLQGRCPV
jgi:hypothetical protein